MPDGEAPRETEVPRAGTPRRTRTFAALGVPNFRAYFLGQSVSLVGTWMQTVAQTWLVLQLSHSGTVLGLVVAAQFLPVLLAGPYGGLVADRSDKLRLLVLTQTTMGTLALGLGLLTVTHVVRLWMVVLFALALGAVNAVDGPVRQTFVPEMVGPGMLQNAVSLNSVMVNAARALGPAAAGLVIAAAGPGVCFLVNAASYAAVLFALSRVRRADLRPVPRAPRRGGQVREGLRHVRSDPGLWVPLGMMAVIGTLAYEFQVVLPLLASTDLHRGASVYGFLTAAMGAGSVVGGLGVATAGRAGSTPLVIAAALFGIALLAASLVHPLAGILLALAVVGVVSTAYLSITTTTLQLVSPPALRGRVMALWSVTFLGSTPVGGPIVGLVAEHLGPRAGLALGAGACLVAAGCAALVLPRMSPSSRWVDALGRSGPSR